MLGFHRRTRSLIPVRDLDNKPPRYEEEVDMAIDVVDMDFDLKTEVTDKARRNQLVLVYVMYLAEA